MTVSHATGDLFYPDLWDHAGEPFPEPVDCIAHGVNCWGVMGSGIAVEFRTRYPHMYNKYADMCEKGYLKEGQVMTWHAPNPNNTTTVIFNIASQFKPGSDAHLPYLEVGLRYVKFYMEQYRLKHLALPRIGAGIGGLAWHDVVACVEDVFDESDRHVTLVSL